MNTNDKAKKQNKYLAQYRAKKRAVDLLNWENYDTHMFAPGESIFDLMATRAEETRMIKIMVAGKKKMNNYEKVQATMHDSKVPDQATVELWVWEKQTGFHIFSVKGAEKTFTVF